MITTKDHLNEDEMFYVDTLTNLFNQHPKIECVLNPIERDSEFVAPVGIIRAMKTLFEDYKFPGTEVPKDLKSIETYYRNLSDQYGFGIKLPEHGLVFEGDKFVLAGNLEKAKEIFEKMDELYPNGLMGFDRLGTIAFKQQEYDLAIEYYEKFLDVEPGNPYAKSMIKKIKKASE